MARDPLVRCSIHVVRAAALSVLVASAGCDAPLYDPFGDREPLVPPTGCASDADCPAGRCETLTGACLGCLGDADCGAPPAGPCWQAKGVCEPATARCRYLPAGAGAGCEDGNACTAGDACDGAGACVAGAARTCDDEDPCTTDGCEPATGCGAKVVEDGTPCGANGEVCRAGRCACGRATTETDCTDGADNDCNGLVDCGDPACDLKGCSDGNRCTTGDVCDGRRCVPGVKVACDAPRDTGCFNDEGVCSGESGSCVYRPLAASLPCDDRDACTEEDACDAAGGCAGTRPVACDAPPGPCWEPIGTCDREKGCSYAPKGAGAACDDADACTSGDACDGEGACVPVARTTCGVAPGACARLAAECDPATGRCTWAPIGAGTICRAAVTGNRCDAPERCDGTSLECPAASPVPDGACCVQPAQSACDDGNACTQGDTCSVIGTCVAGATVQCESPPGPCWEPFGTCDRDNGCAYEPKAQGASCSDANACTGGDACDGKGACVPGAPVSCGQRPGVCAKASATCDPATGSCAWAPLAKGTVCGSSVDPCRFPRVCDGSSFVCPVSTLLRPDGTCCAFGLACVYGECKQRKLQCTGFGDEF